MTVGDGVERPRADDAPQDASQVYEPSTDTPAARPYQTDASPYRRTLSSVAVRPHQRLYPCVSRSTATKSTLYQPAVVPQQRPAAAITSSSDTAYGGSANTKSNGSSAARHPAARDPAQKTRHLVGHHLGARRPGPSALTFVLDRPHGLGVGLDQQRMGRPPRQRLQPDRARTRVQVEDPGPASGPSSGVERARRSLLAPCHWSAWSRSPAARPAVVHLPLPAMIRESCRRHCFRMNDAGQEWTSVGLDCVRVIHIARSSQHR